MPLDSQDTDSLFVALLGDEDDEQKSRVETALEEMEADDGQREIILTTILPMMPELKEYQECFEGKLGLGVQFRRLIPQILDGSIPPPTEAYELASLVQDQTKYKSEKKVAKNKA